MKRQWTTEELVEQWSVEPGDEHLLSHKEKQRRLGLPHPRGWTDRPGHPEFCTAV
jgi:hypothetical protein